MPTIITANNLPQVTDDSGDEPIHVGMVLHKPFPPDQRVLKEARTLINAGYKVYLLCLAKPNQAPEEIIEGVTVVRVAYDDPGLFNKSNFSSLFIHEPWDGAQDRFGVKLGPIKLTWKVPRQYSPFSYSSNGHTIWQQGAFTWRIPNNNRFSPLAWLGANRGFFAQFSKNLFLQPFWLDAIHRFAIQYGIEVLHIHDLPLVHTGAQVARRHGIPLVADLHENWPVLMASTAWKYDRYGWRKWLDKRLKSPARWTMMEKDCVQQADGVICVSEEAQEYLVEYLKGKDQAGKVRVVSNFIEPELFLQSPVHPELKAMYADRFVVQYIGGFGAHRGIDLLIRACAKVKKDIPNLLLYLAGSESPHSDTYLNYCKDLVTQLDLASITHFTGWVPDQAYRSHMEVCDIGVIPHKDNAQNRIARPNKLFSTMLLGKPVLSSNLPSISRIIEETGCGICFETDNVSDLAAKIRLLYENPKIRQRMGLAGQEWVYQKYNWDVTAQQLLALYDNLALRPVNQEVQTLRG